MASFPKINAYTRNQPEAVLFNPPIIAKRAPTANDINYPLGQLWVNQVAATTYILARVASNIATWAQMSTAAGDIDSVTGNAGGAVLPVAGNVNLLGDTTTITTTGAGATLTFGLVASPVITGVLTVNTGIIVPAGGISALGITNINVSGAANTNIASTNNTGTVRIGNALSTAIDIIGTTGINVGLASDTDIGTAGNTGTVSIGSSASTAIDIVGPVFINTSGATGTAINTGPSTGQLVLGNATGNTVVQAGNFTVTAGNITASAGAVSATNTGANRAIVGDTSGGTGVTATLVSSGATFDTLQLTGGGIKVAPVVPASGASPRVASGRFGVASFTDNVATTATVALAITNTVSTATSHVMATVQCATVGSACVIRNIDVSVAGTITCNVTNLGGTDTTGADVVITFWLWD